MKVIIAGSRSIFEYNLVEEAVEESGFDISCVVSGMAKGVDVLGEQWAIKHIKNIHYCPANWNKHGKSAGYIRNAEMADIADALIAIWDGKSKGTKHMIDIAKTKGLQIYIKEIK